MTVLSNKEINLYFFIIVNTRLTCKVQTISLGAIIALLVITELYINKNSDWTVSFCF